MNAYLQRGEANQGAMVLMLKVYRDSREKAGWYEGKRAGQQESGDFICR